MILDRSPGGESSRPPSIPEDGRVCQWRSLHDPRFLPQHAGEAECHVSLRLYAQSTVLMRDVQFEKPDSAVLLLPTSLFGRWHTKNLHPVTEAIPDGRSLPGQHVGCRWTVRCDSPASLQPSGAVIMPIRQAAVPALTLHSFITETEETQ